MRKLIYIISACVMVVMVACGTSGKQTKLKHQQVVVQKDPLTPEQRRKYDYYFLEAVRMKQKGDYDAAYELYQHCLDIYPASGAALYELSQFYMYLGQERKGELALKQAEAKMIKTHFIFLQQLYSSMDEETRRRVTYNIYLNAHTGA